MIESNFSIILVFLAGMISFLSPCILPIIPLYLGYLASGVESDSNRKAKVIVRTIFFVLGISVAFFFLGMIFSGLGQFLGKNRSLITRISGIIIIIFGLIQIGFLDFKFLEKTRKFKVTAKSDKMGPLQAFVMGFTFSFAWTPCVGPMLSSILLLASSAKSMFLGNVLVLVYTLGFIVPFIIIGLLSSKVFEFIKTKGKILAYISKFGGIILIIMGIMVYTGWLNNVSSYLSQFGGVETLITQPQDEVNEDKVVEAEDAVEETEDAVIVESEDPVADKVADEKDAILSMDFTLMDQHGISHTLSEYQGKTVFLNFWATGCPPCKDEVPHIIDKYNEYNQNQDDLIIISVVNPGGFLEGDREAIDAFIEEYGIDFPVLFDYEGTVFSDYNISSIPTTFLINTEGEILGYVPGGMTADMMSNVIKQALSE
jgi:cytochrome c-type biogenesis protein